MLFSSGIQNTKWQLFLLKSYKIELIKNKFNILFMFKIKKISSDLIMSQGN